MPKTLTIAQIDEKISYHKKLVRKYELLRKKAAIKAAAMKRLQLLERGDSLDPDAALDEYWS